MQDKLDTRAGNDIVIGHVLGIADGHPMVVFPGNTVDAAIAAKTLQEITYEDIGAEVALLFENGDYTQPVIMGRIRTPSVETDDPEREKRITKLTASDRLELRCGDASVILTRDGRVTVRGTDIVNRASGSNRLRGGSVHIN
jgi:hypothetical protein